MATATFATVMQELALFHREREDVIRGLLVALIAKEHVFMVGQPGTAKSLLSRDLTSRVKGWRYFEWLVTKFSTPEELFGPISLAALENDEYHRITRGKLPEAHIVFLDEIFKASSGILNTLLAAVNERKFHNNSTPVDLPLQVLIGASNEIPSEPELAALYDRLLLRYVVRPIQDEAAWVSMLTDPRGAANGVTTLDADELAEAQAAVPDVRVGLMAASGLVEVRRALAGAGIHQSDRRWKKSLRAAQAHAVLHGREEVLEVDLSILAHTLWDDPEEERKVLRIVSAVASPLDAKALDFEDMVTEIRRNVLMESNGQLKIKPDPAQAAEANAKMKDLLIEMGTLIKQGKRDGTDVARLSVALDRAKRVNREICERGLGIDGPDTNSEI